MPRTDLAGEEFATLRNLLIGSGFTQSSICQRLHLSRLSAIDPEAVRARNAGPLDTASHTLIRLFLEGWPVTSEDLHRTLGVEARVLLEKFRLIVPHNKDEYAATVTLYPIEDLFIASDRYNNADGSPYKGWDDLVYPCLHPTTERLITGVPRSACDSVLDMCAGTGIGGLLCAATAKRVLAVDLTARCVHFVRFNAMLNGFTNVEAREGNLYEPVEGEQFDRITVHPPYQPVWQHLQTFNSGGIDGEHIAKGVLEGAPAHLKPGGRMYCLCQLSDREQPAEARVRSWLSPEQQAAIDIAFVCFQHRNLVEYSAVSALCENWPAGDWRQWMERLRPLGIRDMVYGIFVLQRMATPRPTFTVRREGPTVKAAEIEALTDWETAAAQSGFPNTVENLRLRLRPTCFTLIKHQPSDAAWKPDTITLRNTAPFEASLQIDTLTAQLIARLDGKKPLAAHLRAAGLNASQQKVAGLVRILVSNGFVERVNSQS